MANHHGSKANQAVIQELEALAKQAEAGTLTGAVLLVTMADGSRREYILGTMVDAPPAEIESMRAVLGELADGDTPGAGLPKH